MAKSSPVVVREPFIKLVKLVANAFYDNYTPESDKQQKSARNDYRGIAVVVLQTLTRRQWIREEDLAKELKLLAKQLRKLLRHFEETARGAKRNRVGRAEDKVKVHMHSYCCLDYSQIYDVVRYKMHRMKKMLNGELEDKDTVQEYGCPKCKMKYNALDALRLICENCNSELVMECNKLISEEVVDGSDNAKRRQRENIKDLFYKMEARAAKPARENSVLNPDDLSRSQGGYGSTPKPYLGETEAIVEVNLGEGEEQVNSEGGDSSRKVLPPWMIRRDMNLTDEQRGEMRQEAMVDGGAAELSDEKKPAMGNGDDNKDLKDEYLKAYYAVLLEQQKLAEKLNEQESAGKLTPDIQLATTSSDRQVGMKCKREEEDVECVEEAPVSANGKLQGGVECGSRRSRRR